MILTITTAMATDTLTLGSTQYRDSLPDSQRDLANVVYVTQDDVLVRNLAFFGETDGFCEPLELHFAIYSSSSEDGTYFLQAERHLSAPCPADAAQWFQSPDFNHVLQPNRYYAFITGWSSPDSFARIREYHASGLSTPYPVAIGAFIGGTKNSICTAYSGCGGDYDASLGNLNPVSGRAYHQVVEFSTDRDDDGDGEDNVAYGGTDCDDFDPDVNSQAAEVWYDGVDQDCDGADDYDQDGDGDRDPSGGGDDCDDSDPAINNLATEIWYDGIDQNCDGANDYDQDGDGEESDQHGGVDCDDLDAAVGTFGLDSWYDGIDQNCDGASDFDQDGDGFDHAGYGGQDCDDGRADAHPGGTEVWYDGIDQDCDGASDFDQDGDGDDHADYGGGDCDDLDPLRHSGASETWYDGVDQDCSGGSDFDQDGDGFDAASDGGLDCDDLDPLVSPAVAEAWYDGVDQNCDGADDFDQDGDGFQASAVGGLDCDDLLSGVNPGVQETWYDGVDQDCSGGSDFDQDGDGEDTVNSPLVVGVDCDDQDASINTEASEIWYDGVDQDCSGGSDFDQDGDGVESEGHGGLDCDDQEVTIPGPEIWYDGLDQDCDGNSDFDQDGDGADRMPEGSDCMLALTIQGTTSYFDESKQDEAMRRYWTARSTGDESAQLVRVDRIPESADRPGATTAPCSVSQVARDRIRNQEDLARSAGFALADPIYAPGTRVLEAGDERFRLERQRIENLPRFDDAARAVIERVRAENREDIPLHNHEFRMSDSGTILTANAELALERPAFSQLATMMGFGSGARYLATRSPDQRAMNVNRELKRADREVVLRTRLQNDTRRVYAVVTPTYAPVDVDTVLETTINTGALNGANAEIAYDGDGVKATAIWAPDEIVDLAAGDVFKAGVRISTDDTGRGRIRISGVLWRNLCLNLIIIDEAESVTLSAVHRGDPRRVLDKIGDGIREAKSRVSDFLSAWGKARETELDARALLRSWVEKRRLKLPSRSQEERDRSVEALLNQWQMEPSDTLAGAVNAVTRSAHADPWPMDIREHLERRAAELVLLPGQRL